jgi:hypothetical protein
MLFASTQKKNMRIWKDAELSVGRPVIVVTLRLGDIALVHGAARKENRE